MSSFHAKIGWKRQKIVKIKIIVRFRSYPTVWRKLKKKAKKFKKLKNTITASFQARIGWKGLRKRENKGYRSVSFLHDVLEKIPKKQKKNSKN